MVNHIGPTVKSLVDSAASKLHGALYGRKFQRINTNTKTDQVQQIVDTTANQVQQVDKKGCYNEPLVKDEVEMYKKNLQFPTAYFHARLSTCEEFYLNSHLFLQAISRLPEGPLKAGNIYPVSFNTGTTQNGQPIFAKYKIFLAQNYKSKEEFVDELVKMGALDPECMDDERSKQLSNYSQDYDQVLIAEYDILFAQDENSRKNLVNDVSGIENLDPTLLDNDQLTKLNTYSQESPVSASVQGYRWTHVLEKKLDSLCNKIHQCFKL